MRCTINDHGGKYVCFHKKALENCEQSRVSESKVLYVATCGYVGWIRYNPWPCMGWLQNNVHCFRVMRRYLGVFHTDIIHVKKYFF